MRYFDRVLLALPMNDAVLEGVLRKLETAPDPEA